MKNNDYCNDCPIKNKEEMKKLKEGIRKATELNNISIEGWVAPCGKQFKMTNDDITNGKGENMKEPNDFENIMENMLNTILNKKPGEAIDIDKIAEDAANQLINNKTENTKSTSPNNKEASEHFFEKNKKGVNAFKEVFNNKGPSIDYNTFETEMNLPMMYSIIGVIELANSLTESCIDDLNLDEDDEEDEYYDDVVPNIFTNFVNILVDYLVDDENFNEHLLRYLVDKYGAYQYNTENYPH